MSPPDGWKKLLGRWCYKNMDVLTDETLIYSGANFVQQNDVLFYLDRQSGKYVPWEQWRNERLSDIQKSMQSSHGTSLLQCMTDFSQLVERWLQTTDLSQSHPAILPTYREPESENWDGALAAWEHSLVELELENFVYVKFAQCRREGTESSECVSLKTCFPLVVGVTGSLLVNTAGSDLDFGEWNPELGPEDVNFTPARLFMYENGMQWVKTHVLAVPCSNREQAFLLEAVIAEHFDLMMS